MAIKTVSLNVHGHRIDLAAYGEKFIGDNDYLAFGDSEDVTMKWDGSKLIMLPVTDDAGSFEIGDGTTNIDVKIWGAGNMKFHWDQDAGVLYLIETSIMAYGSTLKISPGGVNAKLSFWGENDYIQSVGPGYLEIGGSSYIRMANDVVLASTIQLAQSASPTKVGELAYGSDNRLEYCSNLTGPIVYKVPFYNSTLASNMGLPTGVGITLGGNLRLLPKTAVATTLGDTYLDTQDNRITYSVGGGIEYKCAILDNAGKLRVPLSAAASTLAGQLYHSTVTGRLTYCVGASLEQEFVTQTVVTGRANLYGPLHLHVTNDNYSAQGDLWFNLGSGLLRYYNGTTIKTIQTD